MPFESTVWVFWAIFIVSGLLVIFLFNTAFRKWKGLVFGDNISHPMLNMAIVIFGGTLHRLPVESSARLLLTAFLVFCLVIRTGYLGALFIFLRSDGQMKEVQSLNEMLNKGFEFYMYESYSDFVVLNKNTKDRCRIFNIFIRH